MPALLLYHYPIRACSSITVNALVELGLSFDDRVVDIRAGEQNSEAYRKVHPFGKVPALVVDGRTIIENVAILMYLDALRPSILFPEPSTPVEKAAYCSDLVWCSATLHTAIRQVRMPMRYTDGSVEGVRAKGIAETSHMLELVESRLSEQSWWYGEDWSILDVYVNWAISTAASTGLFPMEQYPAINAHNWKLRERESFGLAMERQVQAKERAGLVFPDEGSWNSSPFPK